MGLADSKLGAVERRLQGWLGMANPKKEINGKSSIPYRGEFPKPLCLEKERSLGCSCCAGVSWISRDWVERVLKLIPFHGQGQLPLPHIWGIPFPRFGISHFPRFWDFPLPQLWDIPFSQVWDFPFSQVLGYPISPGFVISHFPRFWDIPLPQVWDFPFPQVWDIPLSQGAPNPEFYFKLSSGSLSSLLSPKAKREASKHPQRDPREFCLWNSLLRCVGTQQRQI